MACLARSIALKAVYLVLAWVLMVSYQIFTQTTLTTLTFSLGGSVPVLASLTNSKADLTIFICSFAWMFVVLSLILILMFGKERKLTFQFLISLAPTLAGSALLGLLHIVGLDLSNPSVLSQPLLIVQ
jgi:hypothetical protein